MSDLKTKNDMAKKGFGFSHFFMHSIFILTALVLSNATPSAAGGLFNKDKEDEFLQVKKDLNVKIRDQYLIVADTLKTLTSEETEILSSLKHDLEMARHNNQDEEHLAAKVKAQELIIDIYKKDIIEVLASSSCYSSIGKIGKDNYISYKYDSKYFDHNKDKLGFVYNEKQINIKKRLNKEKNILYGLTEDLRILTRDSSYSMKDSLRKKYDKNNSSSVSEGNVKSSTRSNKPAPTSPATDEKTQAQDSSVSTSSATAKE